MNRKRLAEALAYVDEMRNRLLNQQPMIVPDEYGQRMGAAGEVAPSLRQVGQRTAEMGRQLTSLDQPQDADAGQMTVDIAAGFTPLQYPQAARDFERARRESDPLGMGLATLAAVPVVGGVAKAANVARKADVAAERAEAFLTAQRNAAKPVSEGGLGLRPENTPMERAEAMGFVTPGYHGTTGNIRNFEKQYRGFTTGAESAKRADFAASKPQVAVGYSFLGEGREAADLQRQLAAAEQKKDFDKVEQLTQQLEDVVFGQRNLRNEISDARFEAEKNFSNVLNKYGVQQDFLSNRPDIGDFKEESEMLARQAVRQQAYARALNKIPTVVDQNKLYDQFEKVHGGKVLWETRKQYQEIAADIESKDANLGRLYRALNEGDWEAMPEFQKDPNALAELDKAFKDIRNLDADYYASGVPSGANVMPLLLKTEGMDVKNFQGSRYRDESYNDLIKKAAATKKPGVVMKETYDPGQRAYNEVTDIYAVIDPSRMRSRFAAFDPAKLTSPDLLAGVAGPTILAAALMEQERRKKERKEKGL
jgi:hypothetical protein